MDINNKYVVTVLLSAVFILSMICYVLYVNLQDETRSYMEKSADIVMYCQDYNEDFIKWFGFSSREDCFNLYKALYKSALKACYDEIEHFDDTEFRQELVDQCAFHTISNTIQIPYLVSFIQFRNEIKQ